MTRGSEIGARTPAHADGAVSRRNMLATVAVASFAPSAAMGASTSGSPAIAPDHPDAELIATATQAVAVGQEWRKAANESGKLFAAYWDRTPKRPDVLRWRPTDPVGYWRDNSGTTWCDPDDIERYRNIPCTREEFVGTDEDWQSLPRDRPLSSSMRARFYEHVPNEEDQTRFNEIIAAHDARNATLADLRQEIGLDGVEARADDIFKHLMALEERVLGLRATTMEGLRAKAEIISRNYWKGEAPPLNADFDESMMIAIVADLIGLSYAPVQVDEAAPR